MSKLKLMRRAVLACCVFLLGASSAQALRPEIIGATSCTEGGPIISWDAQSYWFKPVRGENPDVRIDISVDFGDWYEVGSGAFIDPVYSFSGETPLPSNAQNVRIRARAVAPWGNGEMSRFDTYGNEDSQYEEGSTVLDVPQDCIRCDVLVEKFCALPGTNDLMTTCNLSDVPTVDPTETCEGTRIKTLDVRYIGGDCTATQDQASKFDCTGDAAATSPVHVIVSNVDGIIGDYEGVELGDIIQIVGSDGNQNNILQYNTFIDIYDESDFLLQTMLVDTSCLKMLNLNDRFGAVRIMAMELLDGRVLSNGAEIDYVYEISNNGLDTLDLQATDDVYGGIFSGLVVPGETFALTTTEFVFESTTSTLSVEGSALGSGAVCSGAASVTVNVNEGEPDPDPEEPKKCPHRKWKKKHGKFGKHCGHDGHKRHAYHRHCKQVDRDDDSDSHKRHRGFGRKMNKKEWHGSWKKAIRHFWSAWF